MKTLIGTLALVLAIPMSFDAAAHGLGGGGFHGGGGGGHGGGGHGGAGHGDGWHGGGWHDHDGGWHGRWYGGLYVSGWPYWDGYDIGDDSGDYSDSSYDLPEDAAPDDTAPTSGWYYYCNNPAGFYPYVQNCADGWQRVSPIPPDVSPS